MERVDVDDVVGDALVREVGLDLEPVRTGRERVEGDLRHASLYHSLASGFAGRLHPWGTPARRRRLPSAAGPVPGS